MAKKNEYVDIKKQFDRLNKKLMKSIIESDRRDHVAQSKEDLQNYLNGDRDVVHLASTLHDIEYDELWSFERAVMIEGDIAQGRRLLAISARHGLAGVLVHATRTRNTDPNRISAASGGTLVCSLGTVIVANWRQAARVFLQAIEDGLDGVFINWHRMPDAYAAFKFLVFLIADAEGRPLDRSIYGFTDAQFAAAYATVLEQWRSTDLTVVQGLVGAMADLHVQRAGRWGVSVFEADAEHLFPYEILAFLRLREWAGLENPSTFEHPLMNTALAVLPPEPLPWPEVPPLDQAIAKFKTEYPEHNYFDQLAVPH